MNIFQRLLVLAWRHPRHLLAAYICLMASSGFALAVPYLLGTTVDQVLQGGTFRQLIYLATAIFILNGMRGIFAYGFEEPKEVTILMNRLKEQGKHLGKDIELHTNKVRHQYKNSECGIKVMIFFKIMRHTALRFY